MYVIAGRCHIENKFLFWGDRGVILESETMMGQNLRRRARQKASLRRHVAPYYISLPHWHCYKQETIGCTYRASIYAIENESHCETYLDALANKSSGNNLTITFRPMQERAQTAVSQYTRRVNLVEAIPLITLIHCTKMAMKCTKHNAPNGNDMNVRRCAPYTPNYGYRRRYELNYITRCAVCEL